MKKKIIIIISILALLVIVAAIIWGPKIVKYKKFKNGIYGAIENSHLGYFDKYFPSLPEPYEDSEHDVYRDQLVEQIDYKFDFKNLRIIKKYKRDTENITEIFKSNFGVDYEVSEHILYEIEVDVRVKYDYDENNTVITEEYSGWNENNIQYNHKWSEWKTEKHTIDAVKIDGKWYYECWDDED